QRNSASLAANRDIRHAANAVRGATTALIQDGSLGCQNAGFSNFDQTTLQAVQAAVPENGRLRDYRAFARSVDTQASGQSMSFAMVFDSSATASQQMQVRRTL